MNRKTIAVLITCFNRRQKTLDSLAALMHQQLPDQTTFEVYLVDDGSTDGTADAVTKAYPQVKVLPGNGSLFWNGGMRLAFGEALKNDYDYYLWLNDDTVIDPEAVSTLLATSRQLVAQGETQAIVAASTRDPQTGELTYGGVVRSSWWHPFRFSLVEPKTEAQPCDTMCGNCVLIPREVVQRVGNLDPAFFHYAGDWDYGLRAKQQGCSVWIAPGYLGTCSQNPQPTGLKESERSLNEQLKRIDQPKGLALKDVTLQPWDEWKVLTQRHGGLLWPIYWLLPYRRLIWISLFGKLGWNRT